MFKIPDSILNKYEFVTLASKRAEQLQLGALPRVGSESAKSTVVAQEEVAAGLINLRASAEAQSPELQAEEE